ncbi:hypothetical protein [Sphingomonas sp. LT1P40]|uniref:hypothetical protein n=1 Tax=Alteristakelama amylovorans TaxID=3096166 RepID=UPI002FC92634
MSEQKIWDGAVVRTWLESRFAASRTDQDRADRLGRAHEDDYDKALAEEFVCRAVMRGDVVGDQARFGEKLKGLLDRDEYVAAGVHDERRFEREVRAYLRKVIKMTKTNSGFEKLLHHQ